MKVKFAGRKLWRFAFNSVMVVGLWSGTEVSANDWPSFRGPEGSGIGTGDPPASWDVERGENILWKKPVEGLANSSPIIWGDRIVLATAVSSVLAPKFESDPTWGSGIVDEKAPWTWKVICLDRKKGTSLWERVSHNGVPKQKRHSEATQANCTPVTDGKYVVVMFGSEGMFCYSMTGELIWKKDFGILRSGPSDTPSLEWGFSSSPVIHQEKVVMQCDVLNDPFIAVLDLKSGRELLRIKRDDVAGWSTPLVIDSRAGAQIICNGYRHMGGYELETGREIWRLAGRGDLPIPRPILAGELILITSNHKGRGIYAIRPSAKGDITPAKEGESTEGLAWWSSKEGSYIPVPLVYDGTLYIGNERGLMSALDPQTGEVYYSQQRIVEGEGGRYYASPVAAGGKLYFVNINGQVQVIRAGRTFERLGTIAMGESCFATPAISGGRLFIRTRNHLYCIGK